MTRFVVECLCSSGSLPYSSLLLLVLLVLLVVLLLLMLPVVVIQSNLGSVKKFLRPFWLTQCEKSKISDDDDDDDCVLWGRFCCSLCAIVGNRRKQNSGPNFHTITTRRLRLPLRSGIVRKTVERSGEARKNIAREGTIPEHITSALCVRCSPSFVHDGCCAAVLTLPVHSATQSECTENLCRTSTVL